MSSIKVPPLGESIVEATVSRWLKNEGDPVAAGDTLVELETDKITVEVPAVSAGVLSKRLKNEGDVVTVGEDLGEISEVAVASAAATPKTETQAEPAATPKTDPQAEPAATPKTEPQAEPAATPKSDPQAELAATPKTEPQAEPAATPTTSSATNTDGPSAATAVPSSESAPLKVSPAASRLAAEENVDLSTVTGSGRGGVVSKPDVMEAIQGAKNAPAPAPATTQAAAPTPRPAIASGTRETREKMTTRRKRIAENLLMSQQSTAHLTTFNEIDMTAIVALRERLKVRVEKDQGVKLSFMPFFVKAACLALKAYPAVNAQIDGDTVVYKHYVNMGIAVAADGGLVVPSVKDADQKSVVEIGKDISALAKKARDTKLTMDDLTGGTFTITNGGVFGSLVSTPIINYPQVGILGLHKTQDRPVAIDGKVEIRPMMYVALSYDHRMVDGQQAVLFLVRIKELMEDPASMLVL